jgi:hypothetical protein
MQSGDGSRTDAARLISEEDGHGIQVNLVDRQVSHSFNARDTRFGKTLQVDAGKVNVQGHVLNAEKERGADLGLGLNAFYDNSEGIGKGF